MKRLGVLYFIHTCWENCDENLYRTPYQLETPKSVRGPNALWIEIDASIKTKNRGNLNKKSKSVPEKSN